MRLRCPSAVVAVLAAAALVPAVVGAQDETPAADSPRVPAPEECQVEPRSVDELVPLLGPAGTPVAGANQAQEPLPAPLGEPADRETADAIEATARELIACFNAGDILRVSALFTDEAVGPALGPAPEDPSGLEREPTPLEPDQQTRLLAVTDRSILDDGRAAAFIVVADPNNPPPGAETLLLVFKQVDGRWLVDGLLDFTVILQAPGGTPEAEGTPAP